MKKKYLAIILIIVTLIICWLIAFFIDYSRCNSLNMPMFVFSTETADDGVTGIYYGLGYKVKVKKYISAEYGTQIESIEMHFLGKVISASITDRGDEKEQYKRFIATVIEETTTYMIVKPNENEIERKASDKIVINYGQNHIDYLFGIGSKVIISYKGDIMETYPAQINANDIVLLK